VGASEWRAVADVDLTSGRGDALIRAAAPLAEQAALELAGAWLAQEERAVWDGGRLRTERVRRLGAITLSATPGPPPGPQEVADAVVVPWEGAGRSGSMLLAATRVARSSPRSRQSHPGLRTWIPYASMSFRDG